MKINIKPFPLTDYQKAIVYSERRFTITEAATKVGKTASHIWWLFEEAHQKNKYPKGANFWWVAPVYGQTEIAFNRMRRKVAKFPTLYRVNLSKLTITTPLDTIINFKSADKPDNLYGEDVYAVVFDEFTRAKPQAWYAIRSTLTATQGKCKMIGNFKGLGNWGHILAKKAIKAKEKGLPTEFEYHKITAWDAVRAGILSEQEILQAQQDLPPAVFRELYLAEAAESPDQLIKNEAIENFFTNDFVKPTGQRYISADIAFHGSDRFVVGVWYGYVLVELVIIDKCDSTEVEKTILGLRDKHGVPYSNIVYDADGLGSFLQGRLKNAVAFINNSQPLKPPKGKKKEQYKNLKSQCYFKLAELMNSNELYCAVELLEENTEKMVQELQVVRNGALDKDSKLTILSKEKVKELIGRSPDLTDMLMMRMYFEFATERAKPSW